MATYVALNEDDPNVLSYLRVYKDQASGRGAEYVRRRAEDQLGAEAERLYFRFESAGHQ